MKAKHYLFLFLMIIGALYVFHVFMGKGGFSGFRSGLGIGK